MKSNSFGSEYRIDCIWSLNDDVQKSNVQNYGHEYYYALNTVIERNYSLHFMLMLSLVLVWKGFNCVHVPR